MNDGEPPPGRTGPRAEAESALPGMEQGVRRLVLAAMGLAILATALPIMILAWFYQGTVADRREEAFTHLIEQGINVEIARVAEETTQMAATPIVATTLTDTVGRHLYLASLLDQRATANQAEILLRDYRGRPVAAFPEAEAPRIMQAARDAPQPPPRPPAGTEVSLRGNTLHVVAPVTFFVNQRVIGAVEFQVHLSRLVAASLGTVPPGHVITIRHRGRDVFGPPAPPERWTHPIIIRLPGEVPHSLEMEVALRPEQDEAGGFLRASLFAIAVAGLLALLAAVAIARRMAHAFTAPLADLVQASRRFQEGEPLSGRAGSPRFREFAILAEAIALAFRVREEETRRARFAAEHDALTELHNRAAFDRQARTMIEEADRDGEMLAVLYLDLDRFKPVNDRHGHEAGDRVLKVVAHRLCSSVRAHDLVSRRGGDEFTLMLRAVPGPEVAAQIGRQIIAEIEKPIRIAPGIMVEVGASIGIALYPVDGTGLQDLVLAADAALAEAKANGRGRCHWFGHRAAAQ